MCGIVGIIAKEAVAAGLIEGLRRLEYRGYDSAGIATLIDGRIERRRAEGKLANLARRLEREPVQGTIGIGHTRWATHGLPTETNAHPIATDRVAVVHNGIIENFQALRRELDGARLHFPHRDRHRGGGDPGRRITSTRACRRARRWRSTLERLEGAFALVFLFAGEHDLLICARRGSPLAIGYGDGEMFVGSDALALAPLTRRITYLEEGDWAVVTSPRVTIFDHANQRGRAPDPRDRALRRPDRQGQLPPFHAEGDLRAAGGDRRHAACADQPGDRAACICPTCRSHLGDLERITIIACGTVLSCRARRQILARTHRPHPGRGRYRLRVPLPRAGDAAGRRGDLHLAIGRDRRHAGGAALCRDAGAEDHRRRQPAGKLDRARGRCRLADPGRARDRRRLDQGLHHPARRAGRASPSRWRGRAARSTTPREAALVGALPRSRRAPARC